MDFGWLLEKMDVVAVVIGFNLVMTGLHIVLGWVKTKTATDLDDKADDFIIKVLEFMKKTVDVVTGNKEHK